MFSVEFKEKNCLEFGILPVTRPSIPAPEENVEEITIPGRDGVLIEKDGSYKPIVIPVGFNFLSMPEKVNEKYRAAKKWLSGSGNLKFSDDGSAFYKVLYVKITDVERTSKRIQNFTAEFTCDPYTYMKSGMQEITDYSNIYNPYSVSHPDYVIAGEGNCTISVNGKTITANVGQNLTINTDLMLAYRTDGTMQNAEITGDYQDLYLIEGENKISITTGFELAVIPNWRCL